MDEHITIHIEIDKLQKITRLGNRSNYDLFIYAIPVHPKRRMDLMFVVGPNEFRIYDGIDFDETKYYFSFKKRVK